MSDPRLWLDRSGTVDGLALRLLETGRKLDPQPGAEERAWTEFVALHGGPFGPAGGGAGSGGSAAGAGSGGSVATSTGLKSVLAKVGLSALAKSLGVGIALGIGAAGALQVTSRVFTSATTPSGAAPTSVVVVATSTPARASGLRATPAPAIREQPATAASAAQPFQPGKASTVREAGAPEDVPVAPPTTPELGSAVAEFPADPADADSKLDAEARELARAKALLTRGEAAAALAVLEQSGRRYPRGVLVQEREALLIEALVRSGQKARGAARARAFFAQYPKSPMATRLRGLVLE